MQSLYLNTRPVISTLLAAALVIYAVYKASAR